VLGEKIVPLGDEMLQRLGEVGTLRLEIGNLGALVWRLGGFFLELLVLGLERVVLNLEILMRTLQCGVLFGEGSMQGLYLAQLAEMLGVGGFEFFPLALSLLSLLLKDALLVLERLILRLESVAFGFEIAAGLLQGLKFGRKGFVLVLESLMGGLQGGVFFS